jgi:hypothetical protein
MCRTGNSERNRGGQAVGKGIVVFGEPAEIFVFDPWHPGVVLLVVVFACSLLVCLLLAGLLICGIRHDCISLSLEDRSRKGKSMFRWQIGYQITRCVGM